MASDLPRSPLAPKTIASLPPLEGVRLATGEAGVKYSGRTDLLLMQFDEDVPVAGVFTKSRCPGAPVDWCRDVLNQASPTCRAIVINSGNANAFTGKKGLAATRETARLASAAIGCADNDILLASTGVIGEPLDASKFSGIFEQLQQALDRNNWQDAAKAIMTTDTFEKLATSSTEIDGTTVTINGIAKGSGMIAPDMATMLGFIVTDAPVAQPVLQSLLSSLTRESFNAITVDSDTSTSDTLLLAATGKANITLLDKLDDPRLAVFRAALLEVMNDLALQIVRDGEGASKLMEITVEGATSNDAAFRIAMAIGNSPLVKTAIAGEDANWGRIVMAVGKAGEVADRDRLAIYFGNVRVALDGERDPDYSEKETSAVMKQEEIPIRVDLGLGDGRARIYSCDLTHGYISINGDYRS